MKVYTLEQTVGPRHRQLQQEGLPGLRLLLTMLNGRDADNELRQGLSWATQITFENVFVLWVFDFVVRRGLISRTIVLDLIQQYAKEWLELGRHYAEQVEAGTFDPVVGKIDVIAVADGRYVMLPWTTGWVDLREYGKIVTALPATTEGVTYNISQIVAHELAALQSETQDDPGKNHAPATES